MYPRTLLLPLAFACAGANASAPVERPDTAPHLLWRSALDDLPAAADPKPIDWRSSNQTVYRLNGHIGHWRGSLQLPPIDPAASGVERAR